MSYPTTSLVLAGAVSKGAYEAGVCAVLAERRIAFQRIVGTSAGALNAAVFAAGVATGRVAVAAQIIEENWRDHAGWLDVVQVSPAAMLKLDGVSTTEKLRASVLRAIERVLSDGSAPTCTPHPTVEFRIVGTSLEGVAIGRAPTTHETLFELNGGNFATEEGRATVALSAAASASFPGLFAPTPVNGFSIVDGGLTNNGPIGYALFPPDIDRVIVVSASTAQGKRTAPHGAALVTELLEILINERLARDIRMAGRVNARIARVKAAMDKHALSEPQRTAIEQAIDQRQVDVIEVRPIEELEGTPFSGFGDAALRARYISVGKSRARAIFGELGDMS